MVSATEQQQGKAVAAENDRERQARQAQEKQQLANNQADWIRYIDSRIDSRVEAYLQFASCRRRLHVAGRAS